jgi:hypothetical protein
VPKNISSHNKAIQELQCTEYYGLQYQFFSVELKPDKKVCVESSSIFINGTDITITGYTNGEEKMSGKGVAAILGYESETDKYVFLIESQTPQIVYIVSILLIPEGLSIFITTRNEHEKGNVFSKKVALTAGYILLGPKRNMQLNLSTGSSVNAIGKVLESGEQITLAYDSETVITGNRAGVLVNFIAATAVSGGYVELKAEGEPWVTEMHGIITGKFNHIYSESDFKSPALITLLTLILIILGVCFVISVIITIVIRLIMAKKQKDMIAAPSV